MKKFLLEILEKKELIVELVKREIKAKYKQSLLGYAWVILVPVINLVVLTIVFSLFLRIPTGGISYPIFLFVALVPWIFTANSISAATKSPLANKTLITKIYLPRVIFPLSSVIAKFVDFFLYILVLGILMIFFKVGVGLTLFYIPLIFVVHLALILGVSFFLAATNIFFRDVENLLEVALIGWMYLTPVLYPPELVPQKYLLAFNLNPMTPIIISYRNAVLYGSPPPLKPFLYSSIFAIVLLILGYKFFKKRSQFFADVI